MSTPFLAHSYPKAIVHVDGDAFFASCEIAQNERLRGMPVVVGKERGMALAVSYAAKNLGVSRGMLIHEIQKMFPSVITLESDYDLYRQYSRRMYDIVRRFTPDVEEYSIDECFADITGLKQSHQGSYENITKHIKETLERDLGISFSIGVAPTKTLAKVASSWNKPAGFSALPIKSIPAFLQKIPIGKVWGIGPNTSGYLQKLGIKTALEFAAKPEWWVKDFLSKPYLEIWHELQGTAIHSVQNTPDHLYKSIMRTRTFRPTSDPQYILSELSKNIELACVRLRKYKLEAGGMSVYLKTQSFTYKRFSFPLSSRMADPREAIQFVTDHFKLLFERHTVYRATGITFYDIAPENIHQYDLFHLIPETSPNTAGYKNPSLFSIIDTINLRHGQNALFLARSSQARNSTTSRVLETEKRRDVPPLSIPYWGEAT